jgi:hypothetical protein
MDGAAVQTGTAMAAPQAKKMGRFETSSPARVDGSGLSRPARTSRRHFAARRTAIVGAR